MHIALLGTPAGHTRPELQSALTPGAQLTAWPSRVGVFPSTPVERDMQAIGHLEAGLSAAAAGADAVVIDSVGDYGLAALQSALAIPAVGSGEAGLAAAATLGRFAIITVWPASMNFVPEALLRAYGHEGRCLGIHNVGAEDVIGRVAGPDGYLAGINRAEPSILGAVVTAIQAAAAAGAEAILLGCTCMSPMAAKVAAAVRLPVINPLAEAVSRAATLAAAATPPTARVVTERAALLTRMVDAIAGEADESCPVCIVDASTEPA